MSMPPGDGSVPAHGHHRGEPPFLLERRAPRSAGIAGIVFSVLFIGSVVLVAQRPPEGLDAAGLVAWFETSAKTPVTIATLYLSPFAGIAFLWFIGVIRDRIGAQEDRFMSTVFQGSGVLFVAMYWAAAAVMASLVAGNRFDAAPALTAGNLESVRSLAFSFLFVLAVRAAAVFMLVASTIGLRTGTFPKWLAIAGYAIALVMLLSVSFLQWIVMLFPVWVFGASVFILSAELGSPRGTPEAGV
jgi:hypothetical protein